MLAAVAATVVLGWVPTVEVVLIAATAGGVIVGGFSIWGPLDVLFGLILATLVLTELITNNAGAVLVFPIALAAAADLAVDARPFIISITVSASTSYLPPIGYQTNTIIYGMGGYRYADCARLGVPLTLLVIAVLLVVVPMLWPFMPLWV